MTADPNDAVAAFTEYAADHWWVASHLTQLAGVTLIIAALLCLARELERTGAASWSRIAAAGAIVSLALAAVLQAVDGIALKRTVEAWVAAPPEQRDAAFHAAFAVRQVEIGLASVLCLSLGVTTVLYAAALTADATYPKWMAALAAAGGVATAVAGGVMAHAGFSSLAMAINMPANGVLLVWMLALGVCMWRRSTQSEPATRIP